MTDKTFSDSMKSFPEGATPAQLQERLRLLSRAVDQSPAAVLITDAQGAIEYVNAGFMRITGYTLNEVIGKTPRILRSPQTAPEVYRELWGEITAGRDWRGEFQNRKKDGQLYWARAVISPIRDGGGAITHFMGIEEDISEIKDLEGQYLQAQKMESVGRLAGGVAHDINNMLTAILGYAALAEKQLPPESKAQDELIEIRAAAKRASGVVRQLLAFSRREIIRPVALDLNELVLNVSRMLRRLIGENIELSTSFAPGLWTVKADPGSIEQVVMNLAVNSRDAMPGGGKLILETANRVLDADFERRNPGSGSGEFVVLAATDNGTGMPPEVLAHLFEPYFTTKEKGQGTGLGLATCFGIAKQHGGFLWPYSEPGHGTTFKLYLPRAAGPAAAGPAETPSRPLSRGSETLLLVEDEPAVRGVISRLLKRLGYAVLEAVDGEEALRVAAAYKGAIHLAVTDVVMPRMGGREFAVRLASARPQTKVLFMSGYTDDAVVRLGVIEKGIHFLQKPVTLDDLASKVREALDS